MNILKVIGWTRYDDSKYPTSESSVAVDDAIITELREKGYKFGGDSHQNEDCCCPVLNNGKKALFSMRGWGKLMAQALEIDSYMEWYMDGWLHKEIGNDDGTFPECVYPRQGVDEALISPLLQGKTLHTMHLDSAPFKKIESGEKTVEVRLNDEKRQKVKVGDIIAFFNDYDDINIIVTEVVSLRHFSSFIKLFASDMYLKTGSGGMSAEEAADSMYKYYTKKQENDEGVMGIEIKVLPEIPCA